MQLPERDDADLVFGAVVSAFAAGGGLGEAQRHVLGAIASALYGDTVDVGRARSVTPAELAEATRKRGEQVRDQFVGLAAVTELVAHPIAPAAAASVRAYAGSAGVASPVFDAMALKAHHLGVMMYADLQRSNWCTSETMREIVHGHFRELLESKLTYTGLGSSKRVSRKWLGLRDCPEGSWGREVAEFYERHQFPFPGTPHGIYEIGAKHDFVHVLADYDADAEGELDVFGFIAGSMPGLDGMVMLAITMGLFQNGTIHHVAGKRVKIARADTLSEPGATERFARALQRGSLTTVDVMGGIDHFHYAAEPLDEVRATFNVVPAVVDSVDR